MRFVRRLLPVGLVPLCLFLVACSGPQGYESNEGLYSVVLPDSPELETRTVNDPAVGARDVHFAGAETDDGAFFVAYFDVPQEYVDLVASSVLLDGLRDSVLATTQSELISEEIIVLDGHPGRSIDASVEAGNLDGILRANIYLVGHRLYYVYWLGSSDHRFSSEVTEFLESFTLTDTVPIRGEEPIQATQSTRPPVAPGFQEFVDPAGNFSITIPAEWTIDVDFGKSLFQEFAGFGPALKFFAGRPIPGGYEPNIYVLGSFVPGGTDWDAYMDELIRLETSAFGGVGTESVTREPLGSFFGGNAERVTYVDRPDGLYPQGFETFAVYLLKGNRTWNIYCAAGRELVDAMTRCKEAVMTFRLER